MCGGGAPDQYDAYNGNFQYWKALFDRDQSIREREARGGTLPGEADALRAETAHILADMENRIKRDPSAGMEMRETKRQGDVSIGRIGIDKNFERFNDGYYDDYRDAYTANYNPELDRQYGEVVDKTTASLAGRGMLESTVGINKFADLQREKDQARQGIASEAMDASNKLRGQVENAKSNLYSLNEASANPQAANAQAVGQATALVAPPSYSPLGQIFASALNNIATFQNARNNSPGPRYQSPYNATGVNSGFGSGMVVR